MTEDEKLVLLKQDLQLITAAHDNFLKSLLKLARQEIAREGIEITGGFEDCMLEIQYASYLYRKRASGTDTAMPRYLRYSLNNRLFSQKAKKK